MKKRLPSVLIQSQHAALFISEMNRRKVLRLLNVDDTRRGVENYRRFTAVGYSIDTTQPSASSAASSCATSSLPSARRIVTSDSPRAVTMVAVTSSFLFALA